MSQLEAVDTLVPPNFITTHGEFAMLSLAPSASLALKTASSIRSFLLMPATCPAAKKNPPGFSSRVR